MSILGHILSAPFLLLQFLLLRCIQILVFTSIFYAIADRFGIVNRLLQLWIEYELSGISNGANITISSIEFELINLTSLKSTIVLYDGIVHTKDKEKWKWESPLIARIGYTKITMNLWSLLDLPVYIKDSFGIKMTSIKDIYSVEMRDVQVFVEKRRNVFNFHLLDERLDLPSPVHVLESLNHSNTVGGGGGGKHNENHQSEHMILAGATRARSSSTAELPSRNSSTDIGYENMLDGEEDLEGAKKADELVKTIVGAVSTLGRAANQGGTKALSNALKDQKDGFVSHLKNVQKIVGLVNENDPKEKSTSIGIAKEGLQVMKQVGKVVEKNVKNMKEQVDALSKPPLFRQDWSSPENPDLFRFGCIVLQDIRIFTKDIIIVPGSEEKVKSGIKNSEVKYQMMSATGWSKPIVLEDVTLYPHELCPPKDGIDLWTLGQPIEAYTNLALERIFTEMATTSLSGELLNNAFADVFAWFKIAGDKSNY